MRASTLIRRLLVILAVAVTMSIFSISCTPVKPWQRGRFTSRCMQASLSSLETEWDVHVQANREGIRGATGAGGASCGCN